MSEKYKYRNTIAFFIFGVCNNFAYILMIAAAQDILNKKQKNATAVKSVEHCEPVLQGRHCSSHSAGLVLLCNILPGFVIKLLYPFIANRVPYGVRHTIVCLLQAGSLVLVALADSVPLALAGVMMGSVQSGLGESAFLGLTSHYHKSAISLFSSGTGMAGVAGSFSYAGLTDHRLLGLSSAEAMLVTLIVPFIFCITYYVMLEIPDTVHQVSILKPQTWFGLEATKEEEEQTKSGVKSQANEPAKRTWKEKKTIAMSLLKYMIPLFVVYLAEYLINQGLVELIIFDCSHGFGTSIEAQYRWYQVLYQVGVFVSRSSVGLFRLNMTWLTILPAIQLVNAVFFVCAAIFWFIPHFGIVLALVLGEGLIGGSAYAHSYDHVHRKVDPSFREFALSVVTLADTSGILVAALAALPIHNAICKAPVYL